MEKNSYDVEIEKIKLKIEMVQNSCLLLGLLILVIGGISLFLTITKVA